MGDCRDFTDDAAHLCLFQNQGLFAAANRIDAGADTCRTGADDDNIVHNRTLP